MKNFRRFLSLASILGLLIVSQTSRASLNLLGAASYGPGQGYRSYTFSPYVGAEGTINILNIVEAGIFYDQNFSTAGPFNLFGVVGRVGLGPLSGLFFDAKVGFSSTYLGVGAGVGVGYRITKLFSLRGGPRLIGGALGGRVVADLGVMFSF